MKTGKIMPQSRACIHLTQRPPRSRYEAKDIVSKKSEEFVVIALDFEAIQADYGSLVYHGQPGIPAFGGCVTLDVEKLSTFFILSAIVYGRGWTRELTGFSTDCDDFYSLVW